MSVKLIIKTLHDHQEHKYGVLHVKSTMPYIIAKTSLMTLKFFVREMSLAGKFSIFNIRSILEREVWYYVY